MWIFFHLISKTLASIFFICPSLYRPVRMTDILVALLNAYCFNLANVTLWCFPAICWREAARSVIKYGKEIMLKFSPTSGGPFTNGCDFWIQMRVFYYFVIQQWKCNLVITTHVRTPKHDLIQCRGVADGKEIFFTKLRRTCLQTIKKNSV